MYKIFNLKICVLYTTEYGNNFLCIILPQAGPVFNLEIGHRGSCWPRQHLTGGQIWKLGVNVKRQRTPSDVNTSCVIGLQPYLVDEFVSVKEFEFLFQQFDENLIQFPACPFTYNVVRVSRRIKIMHV